MTTIEIVHKAWISMFVVSLLIIIFTHEDRDYTGSIGRFIYIIFSVINNLSILFGAAFTIWTW